MIKGWLKSIPPESLNPQGAGPWRTTFWGIVDGCPGALPLLFPVGVWGGGCCWQGTCWTGQLTLRELVVTPQLRAPGFIPAPRVTSASPSASPPTEGSIRLRQIKPEHWKVYKFISFICCFSVPLGLKVSQLQDASFWLLKAALFPLV